jgi:hypothetical protein
MSIPVTAFDTVTPSVLAGGGNALALVGLFLSGSPLLPVGAVMSFPNSAAVQAYFGNYNSSFSASFATNVMTVSGTPTSVLAVGQQVQAAAGGTALPENTYISQLGTGTGGAGTYILSTTPGTIASQSCTSQAVESAMATTYFSGFTNSNKKPSAMLFYRYCSAAAPAFLRGASNALLTLAQVQAISAGQLSVVIDGVVKTATGLNLGAATSMSNAAALITAALSLSGTAAVTYSSQFNAFVITSGTTGASSSLAFATSSAQNVANLLGLDATSGGTLSQGSIAMTPATAMAALTLLTQNWVGFTTTWEPVLANKELFGAWVNGTSGQFLYAEFDSDPTIIGPNSSYSGFAYWADIIGNASGVVPCYQDPLEAAFVLGAIASIDFTQQDGAATLAFKSGTGLSATITNGTAAANAIANGYNFYGAWATAANNFNFFYNGQITGPYNWIDAYVNAIQLNSALQLAMVELLVNTKSIPYTNKGYGLIKAACMDTINAAVNFGSITPNVPLSALQIAEVNAAASLAIDGILATRGWYLQVLPATATARQNRTTPPCSLWYMYGGSVQQINLASVFIP